MTRLAEITPGDVDAMRAFWEALAPPGYEGLVDAEREPPTKGRA